MTNESHLSRSVIDLPLANAGTGDRTSGTQSQQQEPAFVEGRQSPMRVGIALRRGFPIAVAFLIGGIAGLYFQPPGLQQVFRLTGLEPGGGSDTPIAQAVDAVQSQETVAMVANGDVVALGRIIPRDDVITLALPFGAGDARIEQMNVFLGDSVRVGDVLALLDNRAAVQSALGSAQANVDVKRAALAQARAIVAASREEALAGLERDQATRQVADSNLARTQELFDRGATTRRELDEAAARADEAARDVERSIATLSRYQSVDDSQPDIALALANLAAAEAELERAAADLAATVVRAPIDGTVLSINAQVGERPGSDGLIDLGNTEVMTVEAEVYQTLIGRVAIGDPVTVIAEAFDSELTGTVTAIGLEIGRQTITSDDPAANTDGRVVDVIVTLDADGTHLARRFTNLEVVVRIDAGRQG